MKRGIILAGLLCWLPAPLERLPGHGVLGRVAEARRIYQQLRLDWKREASQRAGSR
ncbi:MAG: hypothetical protein OXI69_07040 [Acidobacteriota bacterium]|nr:hypothetical protein [Acidobacteriota bacterium]